MEKRTKEFEKYLYGCRFCPMCKPSSDSLNATLFECNATRAHAMIIWRAQHDIKDYTEKEAELLYTSNLDSVSEAFCVDHYPVSQYMLAARQDIVDAGKAPQPVQQVLSRRQDIRVQAKSDTLLVCSEGTDIDSAAATELGNKLAAKLDCGMITGYSGYLPYVLGDTAKAAAEAKSFAEEIKKTGAKKLIASGPETLYTLKVLYPTLGIQLPCEITTLTERLFTEKKASEAFKGKKVFFHDCRAAFMLADTLPDEKVIMPEFTGPEELLGEGAVFELPRKALKDLGAELVFSVWSRAMSNAMGNDEGVSSTYPALARKMATRRLKMIADTGAEYLVTDSMATYLYLAGGEAEIPTSLKVVFLADLA